MDRTKKGIVAIAGFCFFLALLLLTTAVTVYNIAGDRSLMAVEMRRHTPPRISGLPDEEYPEMGRMITEYLTGKRDTFQHYFTDAEGNLAVCFQPHEANHMADCRELIRKTGILRWILAGAALFLLAVGIVLRKYRNNYTAGMIAGFGFTALMCVGLLAWGLVSFDSLFTAFHRLLFTNDGWILDARTDMLVRLMPTSFFVSLGIKLLLACTAAAAASLAAALMARNSGDKGGEQEEQPAETAVQGADV